MRITPDTNVLLRVLLADDPVQSPIARELLESAEEVVLTLPAICELDWVLRKQLRWSRAETAAAIRMLLYAENVRALRATIEEGLEALEHGADLADGIIAYDGAWSGGETFVSFDVRAVAALRDRGHTALIP